MYIFNNDDDDPQKVSRGTYRNKNKRLGTDHKEYIINKIYGVWHSNIEAKILNLHVLESHRSASSYPGCSNCFPAPCLWLGEAVLPKALGPCNYMGELDKTPGS